jgi:adenylate cyclase
MTEERSKRRLAAILAADVLGFSRLMEQDETGTLALKVRRGKVPESRSDLVGSVAEDYCILG